MTTKENVLIFDTTLRDGEQSAGIGLTLDEKMEIARQLERLGVDIIEAGFAASSPGDFEAVSAIAKEVRTPTIASAGAVRPRRHRRRVGGYPGSRAAPYPHLHFELRQPPDGPPAQEP